ncbi:MAG: flagellar hook-associated protein FlgK, partial [Pseudomonadales bacterium]
MASFNLLNIGTQALNTNNTALATTSQNIANANTDGYTRQRSEIMSVNGLGGSYVQSISRTTDQFLTKQMWSDVSTYKSLNIQDNLMSQTDNLLASSSTSLSTALDNYFVSMQNAVDDPTSLANRELYIEQTNALSRRFNDLSAQLDVQNDSVNETLKSSTALLNEYSQSIADINKQINYLTARDEPTNELKDQRDLLINKISELVDVQVVEQGADFNMFIGNGQPLVVGDSVNRIEYRQGDPDPTQPQLFVYSGASELEISDKLQGGTIGGVLEFRENT